MRFNRHRGYTRYRMPVFITHASDRQLVMVSELGEFTVTDLTDVRTTGRVLYSCVDPDTLCLYGDPTLWRIRSWNSRVSSMEYAGVKVYPLTDSWSEDVFAFFRLLDDYGVAASSLNTMSLNLWRTTLDQPVSFHEETPLDQMLGPVVIHTGGRKEARRGTYRNRVEYDITTAYPVALGDSPLPTLVTVAPDRWLRSPSLWSGNVDGLCMARVRIPPMRWGPIPVILDLTAELTCYGFTQPGQWATVTLPLSELRMAAEAGVDIEPIRLHVGLNVTDRFGEWLRTVVPALRSLPGVAGVIGKLVANRLWSSFAVSPYGVRKEHTFTADGVMLTELLPPDPTGQVLRRAATSYVGALVQSRVRQRLWREGINHFPDVVYVDTDGLIAKPTATVPPGWRAKTVMRWVDVAGAQAVNYYCKDCRTTTSAAVTGVMGSHDGPHWTVAGANTTEAKSRLFRLLKEHHGLVMTNINNVIPAQDVNAYAQTDDSAETDSTEAFLYLTGT